MSIRETRLDNWQDSLYELIEERRRAPMVWGQHDCALWISDCVLAMTGFDPAEHYRGTYSTAKGAWRRLVEQDNVTSPEELADKVFGERLPIALARVGDVVVADMARLGLADPDAPVLGRTLGICYGRSSLFVGSDEERHGLITLRTLDLEWCYRV